MAKAINLTSKGYTINSISPVYNSQGKLIELNVSLAVNYGTEGRTETINILPLLTSPDEVAKAGVLYAAIARELDRMYR